MLISLVPLRNSTTVTTLIDNLHLHNVEVDNTDQDGMALDESQQAQASSKV